MQANQEYIFEAIDIDKRFGGIHALKKAKLQIKKGEVHALLGENGAGKSTLMKIIIGLEKSDSGVLRFKGEEFTTKGPAHSLDSGIAMIHQELNIEPYLTVAENIYLNRESTVGWTLNKKDVINKAKSLIQKFGFDISPTAEMGSLSIAQAQMIEIMKAASCDAKLIIMDEPTSSLDSDETKTLFRIIRELKELGVSIIYISHRLEEVFEMCETVSIFRDGEFIVSYPIEEVDKRRLICDMVGREVNNLYPRTDCEIGAEVLEVKNLCGKGFNDISFKVRKGEILGLSGLVGAGRSETVRAIFGLDPYSSGEILIEGKVVSIKNAKQAINYGIAMVNEDRKKYGLCLFRSLRENIALPTLRFFQKGIALNVKKEKQITSEISKQLSVKCSSLEQEAYALSGGNQQKVVICKWLLDHPKILIMDEPTRGIDVGAKSEIHKLISRFASEGMAVIMISSELPEVMGMSDRILVYHEGRIHGEVSRADILSKKVAQDDILAMAFGQ